MPLFREHRGSIEDSLRTTVIVENIDDLKYVILQTVKCLPFNIMFGIKIIRPYHMSIQESFDPRCGWYTHYVMADLYIKDEFNIIGMLSEPF